MILEESVTVTSWFSMLQADFVGEHVKLICLHSVSALGRVPDTNGLAWWLSCQDHLEPTQTLSQLEELLPKINYVEPRSEFDSWIQVNCLPDNPNTFWYQLSELAQQKLKSFYHVTTFKSVKKIFDALCETGTDPSLTETHVRNLDRRTSFWIDYSDSFGRVRFLLTQRSKKLLAHKIDLEQERVTIMEPFSLNDASEICIFEIGNFIFIERFRGSDFDLGVFTKTPQLEKLLFDSQHVDALLIAKLTPDWVVDHKDYWQKRMINFLLKKGIKPNKNNSLAKNWFMALTKDEQKAVDEMKIQRNYNNSDISSYFRTGQKQR
ncbi:MAG: EH signature domain-containing protein [Paraglaciecola sp.]|nr:EH signature domain-containing protein [Paraglaciecola sp.]